MKILGIDPGTITTGYGVIDGDEDNTIVGGYGAINSPKRSPIGERLNYIYQELQKIISKHAPDEVAVEQPFVMTRNVKSALAIGRAQAVAILAATSSGLPVYEYTPAQIKQAVADYGASTKEQIQEMIKLQLDLKEPLESSDAADALATALCHLRQKHLSELLSRSDERTKR